MNDTDITDKVIKFLRKNRVVLTNKKDELIEWCDLQKTYFVEFVNKEQIPKKLIKYYFRKLLASKKNSITINEESFSKTLLHWFEMAKKNCPKNKKVMLIAKTDRNFVILKDGEKFRFTVLDWFVK